MCDFLLLLGGRVQPWTTVCFCVSCNKNYWGPIFAVYRVGEQSGRGRGWGLLHCIITYICANTPFWWVNTNILQWAILKQRPGILHLALIFHRLQMPVHRNHKTSSQRNANCTQEQDNKIARFCLFVQKQKWQFHSILPGICKHSFRSRLLQLSRLLQI